MKRKGTVLLTILLFPFVVKSQAYKSFRISPKELSFNLSKDQGITASQLIYDPDKNELLRAVRYPKSAIEIFDIPSGNLKKKVFAPDNNLDVFLKVDDDNFWVHDQWKQTLTLINGNGAVKKTLTEPRPSPERFVNVSSGQSCFSPVILYKNAFYMSGMIMISPTLVYDSESYKKTGVVEKLTMDGKVSLVGRTAMASYNNYFGDLNRYSTAINKNKLIISPFFSNELEVLDLDANSLQFINKKNGLDSIIQPMGNLNERTKFNREEHTVYFKDNYRNVGILYDSYRKVYYRFTVAPSQGFNALDWTISVLDENFNLIFKEAVPATHNPALCFVTKKGLVILNRANYNADNTKMIFDLFTLNQRS